MGDPGGVGPELCIAALRALQQDGPTFFVIADPACFSNALAEVIRIADPVEAPSAFSKGLPVIPTKAAVDAAPGVSSPENADAVIESITRAVDYAIEGSACGVVTNPIQKSSLYASGFHFPGHTEFLSSLTMNAPMANGRTRGSVMMIACPDLRTVPVTIHQSVVEAAKSLNGDLIVSTAIITAQALKTDFGIDDPRLAISGLNPHAGEKGALGAEDEMIIAPAVDRLKEMGLDVRGPLPADTMFHEEARRKYDAALCMLHDQALIPAKTLSFHDAVNVTLGLPIVRTSPDHGTALDIAGKGLARPDSLIAAIRLAAEMASRRRS